MSNKTVVHIVLLMFFGCCHYGGVGAHIIARDKSSTLKVSALANLRLKNNIKDFEGTIEREAGATIEGNSIYFNKGVFYDELKRQKITGIASPGDGSDKKITLSGDHVFRGDGQRMLYRLIIQGVNNLLYGEVVPGGDIELFDQTSSCSYAGTRQLDKNILLNGGLLALEADLKFLNSAQVVGPGRLDLCQHKLIFGTSKTNIGAPLYFQCGNAVELNGDIVLDTVWTFSGSDNIILGNGNKIFFGDSGSIIVERGSSVKLRNVVLDGVGASSIFCMDNAGTVTLNDVIWLQDDDYTFSRGSLCIDRMLDLNGAYKFIYQSMMTSTIKKNSTLVLEQGMTFSYDPIFAARNNLIAFEDSSSVLYLSGGTLHATSTGMLLTVGTLIVEKLSTIRAEVGINSGIYLGNNISETDFSCNILNSSILDFTLGNLVYQNVNASSWAMFSNDSILKLEASTILTLEQNLQTLPGRVLISPSTAFINNGGMFSGNVEIVL